MRTRAKSKLPKFKSIKQEAEFWDSHNVTDYLPEMKEVEFVLKDAPTLKKETLTIRVQSQLKETLRRRARSYGLSTSTLARMWIVDKLREART